MSTEAAPAVFATPLADLTIEGKPHGGIPVFPAVKSSPLPAKERLLLRRSTAHRGGKTVLVLEGFSPAWASARLEKLLQDIKSSLGCGGKIRDRTLEIQGEQADRLQPLLEARGFDVKRGW